MLDKLKGAWRSKTIWFNGLLLTALPVLDQLQQNLPQLHDYMTDDMYRHVGLVAVAGNMILRFVTKTPLELK